MYEINGKRFNDLVDAIDEWCESRPGTDCEGCPFAPNDLDFGDCGATLEEHPDLLKITGIKDLGTKVPESRLFKNWRIFIGHAKKKGATEEELDILVQAADLIRKYGPVRP